LNIKVICRTQCNSESLLKGEEELFAKEKNTLKWIMFYYLFEKEKKRFLTSKRKKILNCK